MEKVLDTSFMINPLFGILVTFVIFTIGYLLHDNRYLRKLNKENLADIKKLNEKLIAIQDKHHGSLLSSSERMVKAMSRSTEIIDKHSDAIRSIKYNIQKLKDDKES